MQQYDIAGRAHRCQVSGRPIEPGEEYHSVLLDTVTGLVRQDFSAEHWTGPPSEAIAHWSGRHPKDDTPKATRVLGVDELLELFDRLGRSGDDDSRRLHYVVTLMLLRRKALKLQDVEKTGNEEFLLVGRPKEAETYRVYDPRLSRKQIQAAENQLADLCEGDGDSNGRENDP